MNLIVVKSSHSFLLSCSFFSKTFFFRYGYNNKVFSIKDTMNKESQKLIHKCLYFNLKLYRILLLIQLMMLNVTVRNLITNLITRSQDSIMIEVNK